MVKIVGVIAISLVTHLVMWGRTYTRRHRARDVRRAAERVVAHAEVDRAVITDAEAQAASG
jgi:ribosomal protein L17